MNTFLTQLKREYWENRGGFFQTPMIVIIAVLVITIMGLVVAQVNVGHGVRMMGVSLTSAVNRELAERINQGLIVLSMPIQFALGIVLFFYLIGSLYDERKDRSVLFWKSMPVSDLQTVLSKVCAATFLAPAIAWVASVMLYLLVLVVIGGFLWLNDISPLTLLLGTAKTPRYWGVMLVGIPVNALWALPSIGWLMLVSSWARSKPFLWAIFVPFVTGILLSWIDALSSFSIPDSWYWKEVFFRGLFSIFPWTFDNTDVVRLRFLHEGWPPNASLDSLWIVLTAPKTWLGAAVGIAMIAGAVYFRRYRELSD